jgi:hypothetical protein
LRKQRECKTCVAGYSSVRRCARLKSSVTTVDLIRGSSLTLRAGCRVGTAGATALIHARRRNWTLLTLCVAGALVMH